LQDTGNRILVSLSSDKFVDYYIYSIEDVIQSLLYIVRTLEEATAIHVHCPPI